MSHKFPSIYYKMYKIHDLVKRENEDKIFELLTEPPFTGRAEILLPAVGR